MYNKKWKKNKVGEVCLRNAKKLEEIREMSKEIEIDLEINNCIYKI